MKYGRTFNFSAGPAMMPEPVLEEIRDEMMNYRGSGMCVMEMSHRSKVFQQIADEAEADLRKLMHIPDNYKVLFIQGGGTVQFAMVAMNLMKNGKACYVETGAWSKKAIAEAKKFGEVDVIASSKDKNFSYIPDCSDLDIPDDCDYVYICENETINGTTWNKLPNTKGHVLVSDQSSMFLSRPCNVSDYGLIWAGVQKNVGPAGMAVVIIREDLIRDDLDPKTPIYLMYKTHADNGSMYNTPNCWVRLSSHSPEGVIAAPVQIPPVVHGCIHEIDEPSQGHGHLPEVAGPPVFPPAEQLRHQQAEAVGR